MSEPVRARKTAVQKSAPDKKAARKVAAKKAAPGAARSPRARAAQAMPEQSRAQNTPQDESDNEQSQGAPTRAAGATTTDTAAARAGRVTAERTRDESSVELSYEGDTVVRRETTVTEHSEQTDYPNGSRVRDSTERRTVREYRDPIPAAGPRSGHPLPVG